MDYNANYCCAVTGHLLYELNKSSAPVLRAKPQTKQQTEGIPESLEKVAVMGQPGKANCLWVQGMKRMSQILKVKQERGVQQEQVWRLER